MAKAGLIEFVRDVRREAAKVTWPTRKETTVTAIMVIAMTIVMAIFFLGVDWVLSVGIKFILRPMA